MLSIILRVKKKEIYRKAQMNKKLSIQLLQDSENMSV